jgi:curved DNA-binding protein CbpA
MELDFRKKIEVEALHKVVDNLDYYSLLKLRPGAPIPEVEKAFAAQSKVFHPDRFFGVRDPHFMKKVTQIFKKLTEAYQVLKDPDLKKMYDEKMGFRAKKGEAPASSTGRHRTVPSNVSKADLEREKAALDADEMVADKRARKYWDLAQIAEFNEDWNGVVMNLQFAMSYEKGNPLLEEKLRNAKEKMAEKQKANANPYKIKIV